MENIGELLFALFELGIFLVPCVIILAIGEKFMVTHPDFTKKLMLFIGAASYDDEEDEECEEE